MKGVPPRVALLVETSLSSGQDILLGIGQYIREHGPWAVYQQPHDLSQPPPDWFRQWEGDGIIARLQDGRVARAAESKRVPVVDVLGVQQQLGIPLVHVDNRAIAEMAAEHLFDRGFTNFAYFGLGDEYWSTEREQGFREYVGARGYASRTCLLSRRILEKPLLVKPWYVAIRESTDFLAVNDAQIAKALHFIRNRCGGRITLDEVARHAGLSRSVLQRRFRVLLNRTVHEEITDARTHKAMDLLRRTELPVDEVAEKSGFGYAQNMGRIFRKRFGRSPKHYRRRPGGIPSNDSL